MFTHSQRKEKQLFLCVLILTFLIGLGAHGFVFSNLFPSHDSLFDLYSGTTNHAFQISLGRPLLPLYHHLTASCFILPWTAGLVALFWLACSSFLIVKIFNIKKISYIAVVCSIVVTNRSIYTVFATYFQDAGAYFFAITCSIFSAFCWTQFCLQKRYSFLLLGSIALMLAMGIYQSYIAVALVMIVSQCILELLDRQIKMNEVFKNGLWSIAMILVGCGLYYLLINFAVTVTGVELTSEGYNSLYSALDQKESFVARFFYCFWEAFSHYTFYAFNVYPQKIIILFNCLIFSTGFIILFYYIIYNKMELTRILFLLALMLCLPLSANILRLLADDVHDIMIFGIWLILLLPLFILNRASFNRSALIKPVSCILCGCLLFLAYSDTQTANLAYVHKKMQYEALNSLMASVLHDIECQDEYIPGETPVVFVGNPSDILQELPEHNRIRCLTGLDCISPITYCWQEYFNYVLQRKIYIVSENEADCSLDEIKVDAPTYPQQGYIRTLNGTIIVKLGN